MLSKVIYSIAFLETLEIQSYSNQWSPVYVGVCVFIWSPVVTKYFWLAGFWSCDHVVLPNSLVLGRGHVISSGG